MLFRSFPDVTPSILLLRRTTVGSQRILPWVPRVTRYLSHLSF
nr:MAG TPA: hypothetical protein [Caudoviricetes sp.]